MRKLVIIATVGILLAAIFLWVYRSLPYSDSEELLTADIRIDSVWTVGPAVALLDKETHTYYWFKSYTSMDQSDLDTLKLKRAHVRYMKFFKGPLENRIYKMEVDSSIVIDQVIRK